MPLFIWSHLRDQPDHGARHAGHRHHDPAGRGRAPVPLRLLRSGGRRRSGALPAPVLVLLAPGGLHHGAAGDGRRSASWSRRSAASRSSATPSSRSPAWRSPCSASWCGATTCSWPASRSTPALIFSILSFLRRDSVGRQGLQLDGDDVQGLDLVADADALRDRLHRAVHDRRADRAVPGGASASTCTSPTPTSSSRTSTTSWSAARSWRISAASTTGGRRSAAASTIRRRRGRPPHRRARPAGDGRPLLPPSPPRRPRLIGSSAQRLPRVIAAAEPRHPD